MSEPLQKYQDLSSTEKEILSLFRDAIAERDKRIAALEVLLRDATDAKENAVAAYRCEVRGAEKIVKALQKKIAYRDQQIAALQADNAKARVR